MDKISFRSTVIEENYEALGKAFFFGRQLPMGQVQVKLTDFLGPTEGFSGLLFIKIRFPNPTIL